LERSNDSHFRAPTFLPREGSVTGKTVVRGKRFVYIGQGLRIVRVFRIR
jgi:hypothetical protein